MTTTNPEGVARLPGRAYEYFALRAAESTFHALPRAAAEALAADIALARQRRDAADTLWSRRARAVAMGLLCESVERSWSALYRFEVSAPQRPEWAARARALLDHARATASRMGGLRLETEIDEAHERAFHVMLDATFAVDRLLVTRVSAPAVLAKLRWTRARRTVLATALVVFVSYRALHEPDGIQAHSTVHHGPEVALRSIDHDTRTSWATPAGQGGTIELTLRPPRAVSSLHLVASNPTWNDRAVETAYVEAFLGTRSVARVVANFPKPTGDHVEWSDVTLGAARCDRIRIEVTSFYGRSAAIAEIELKP